MKRIALSLFVWAALALPANAQNFVDLPSWQHWNLNTMSSDEQARIRAGVKNGSLTANEASRLQDRLNSIDNLKARLSSGGLNMSEKLKIDSQLDDLAQQIFKESRDGDRNKWLGNKPWDWARMNKPSNLFNLNAYQHWNLDTMTTDEEARINAGIRNGSLTREEANSLRARLNRVNDLKAQLSLGGMSLSERMKLDKEIDDLAEKIYKQSSDGDRNRWLGNSPFDWARGWHNKGGQGYNNNNNFNDLSSWQHWNLNVMTTDEQARISAGLKNGSLTRAEANALQARLNQINNLKGTLSQGGLSLSERRRIDAELDSLGQAIFKESRDSDRGQWLGSKPHDWTRNWKNDNVYDHKDAKRDAKYDKHDYKNNKHDWQSGWNPNTNGPARNDGPRYTKNEQRDLATDLNQINRREDRMRDSGNGISAKEQRKLDKNMNKINRKANRDRND